MARKKKTQSNLKFALLSKNATLPTRSHETDAGVDLYSPTHFSIPIGEHNVIGLQVSCEIPDGYALIIKGRSGLAMKHGVFAIGGVVDSGYRGEIHVGLCNLGLKKVSFVPGDRVAQALLVAVDLSEPEEVDVSKMSKSSRGEKGLGSTGK